MTALRITTVTPKTGLVVHCRLTDGSELDIDLTPFLWGPVFEEIVGDRDLFERVTVDPVARTLTWPNGADIDPDVLLGFAEPVRRAPSAS